MPFTRQIFFRTLGLYGLLTLYCFTARAQEAAPAPPDQTAEARIAQQQAYEQAIMDCTGQALPRPELQGGKRVDPSAYQMTDDKMQIVMKCMSGKGVMAPPSPVRGKGKFVQKYLQKGVDPKQMITTQANVIATMWKTEAEAISGAGPGAASQAASVPAEQNTPATEAPEPPPKIYIAPPEGNKGGNGGEKPLWVVPQSQ